MTAVAAPVAAPVAVRRRRVGSRSWLTWAGLLVFLVAVGYLVLMPLYRLQAEAFRNGAEGYRTAYTAPGIGRVDRLHRRSSRSARWPSRSCSARCSPGRPAGCRAGCGFMRILPILPIVVPAVASVVGWAFLFSPRPGYLNALCAICRGGTTSTEGPVDIYTMPWIVIITGFGLTSFVYLFVSAGFANISAEHLEAAQVAGSSTWGVFFKVTLPLLRPTLIYGGGVALLLGLGQFTAPLLLGRNGGIDVITTEHVLGDDGVPDRSTARPRRSARRCCCFGIVIVVVPEVPARRPAPLRHPRRQGVPHDRPSAPSSPRVGIIAATASIATVLPIVGLGRSSRCRVLDGAKIDAEQLHPRQLPHDLRPSRRSPTRSRTASRSRSLAVLISLPVGLHRRSTPASGRSATGSLRTTLDFLVAMPLGVPAVIFGAGFLLTYTREPFVLYGTQLGDRPRLRDADAPVRHAHAAVGA